MPKKVEDGARALNQVEHILERPDTYVGSTKTVKEERYVAVEGSIYKEKISYNSALERIIMEILSNAVDNKIRSDINKVKMSNISINFDEKTGEISIENDGYQIPVEQKEFEFTDYVSKKVKKQLLYYAQLYFTFLLTGTNYSKDGKDERFTAGKNGYGAKLTAIFSKKFCVEHTDTTRHKKFVQVLENNMDVRGDPEISAYRSTRGYVRITFTPDYERFKYTDFDSLSKLLLKHAYDTAMLSGVNVSYNGFKIKPLTLDKYAKLYFPKARSLTMKVSSKDQTKNDCVIVEIPDDMITDDFQQISFVNGIMTLKGGAHVDGWSKAIFPNLTRLMNANKKKEMETVSGKHLMPYLALFVNTVCLNPSFTSQTKEYLSQPDDMPVKKLSEEEYEKLKKWDFITKVYEKLDNKIVKAQKVQRKVLGVDKLSDAKYAGTKRSEECSIFLTEGDSARQFINTLISRFNKSEFHGSFSLRGKVLNVITATKKKITANKEVQEIMKIIGLRQGVDYSKSENRKTLRYNRVYIATDADADGKHITGLLFVLFWKLFPSLFLNKKDPFVYSMNLPLVSATIKKGEKSEKLWFFTNEEYEEWKNKNPDVNHETRYIKGLAGYTNNDVVDLSHTLSYYLTEHSDMSVNLAFNEKEREPRKKWLADEEKVDIYNIKEFITEGSIAVEEFLNGPLKSFFMILNGRSIPHLYDGLKIGQRKALWLCITEKLKTQKVGSLVGQIVNKMAYHYGAKSEEDTIVGMAQGFVGSNNIPLFKNEGQFGTRNISEKNHGAGASRYLYTGIDDIVKVLFPEADNILLERVVDEGTEYEPVFFVPILPMVLINGAKGIGSGYSTNIPNFNPVDIISYIRKWMVNEKRAKGSKPLVPYYKGFKGEIYLDEDGTNWYSKGSFKNKGSNYEITELPIGVWTEPYVKDFLEVCAKGEGDFKITNLHDYRKLNTVKIEFKCDEELDEDDLGLVSKDSMRNFVVLDEQNRPKHYKDARDIIDDFCIKRLALYDERKAYQLKVLKKELKKNQNRLRFVNAVYSKEIDMMQKRAVIEDLLETEKYDKYEKSYDYLMSMHISSMTVEKMNELKKLIEKLEKDIEELKSKTNKDLWEEDLVEFEKAYEVFLKNRCDDDN